jgi:hypothetical protein
MTGTGRMVGDALWTMLTMKKSISLEDVMLLQVVFKDN